MTRLNSAALAGFVSLIAFLPNVGFSQDTTAPQSSQPGIATQPLPPTDAQAPSAVQAPADAQPPSNVQANAPPTVPTYTTAQLDQMLAPIAIYPDTLLTDILMASTYPVQVVEAERWLQKPANARLKGDALVQALEPMAWDPSVKSLVPFPMVVKQMNDQLEWTQQLGTAFANQQADVMERVQALRQKCEATGKLANVSQLHVVHQGPAIVIEPAAPDVVYVPVYNPAVIYGPWPYVEYPPVFFTPAVGFYAGPIGVDIGFSVGFGIVGPFWGWGYPAWGEHNVVINNVAYTHISYNHMAATGGVFSHRGPVGTIRTGATDPHGLARGAASSRLSTAAAAHGMAASRGSMAHASAASHGSRGFGSSASRSFSHGTSQAHAGSTAGSRFGAGHGASRSFAGAAHGSSFGGSRFGASHAGAPMSHAAAPRGGPARGSAGRGSPGGHHHG